MTKKAYAAFVISLHKIALHCYKCLLVPLSVSQVKISELLYPLRKLVLCTAVQMVSSHAARPIIGPTVFIPTDSCLDNSTFWIADNCEGSPPSFS